MSLNSFSIGLHRSAFEQKGGGERDVDGLRVGEVSMQFLKLGCTHTVYIVTECSRGGILTFAGTCDATQSCRVRKHYALFLHRCNEIRMGEQSGMVFHHQTA